MVERRPWLFRTNRQPPKRFRDILPAPLPSLPPTTAIAVPAPYDPGFQPRQSTQSPPLSSESIGYSVCKFITPRNLFGLTRRFFDSNSQTYDPEDQVSLETLFDTPETSLELSIPQPVPISAQLFHPYPNRTAFKLGEWFWNGGPNKSQAGFQDLIKIIGDPEFKPADVRDVRWDSIDKALAADEEGEWQEINSGWSTTPVTISVPYQQRRGIRSSPDASPRSYTIGDFHHRNLVSIVREKLTSRAPYFHFSPYELHWQPPGNVEPIRVQSELYTSPAFLDEYCALQNTPGEPGCDLPRVIAGLMFSSDATQLTSFGNAKLWPLYMFFANESKYYRCRPSFHLCEHVAYFQTVSFSSFPYRCRLTLWLFSSQTTSKILLQLKPQVVKLPDRLS